MTTTAKHTPEPWRLGSPSTVVADSAEGITLNGATGPENVEYYGGNLICESVSNANASRIVACVNACKNVSNEWLQENAVYALIEDKERIERREANHIALLETQRDELLNAIKAVRSLQKEYFKSRDPRVLASAKQAEANLDKLINTRS
jgi:hypothetical protein